LAQIGSRNWTPRAPSAENASLTTGNLAPRRRVARVDLGCLRVGVAEVLLDRPQRDAGSREAGREGMAQIVEADRADAGGTTCRLEALADLAAVQRVPGLGVGENEVVVCIERSPSRQLSSQRARRSAIGTDRRVEKSDLPSTERSPRVGIADADPLRLPVDVAPPQPEWLGAAQPGHAGR
jgi:hypothetical protein